MITKVTKENKGLYRALFEKASKAYSAESSNGGVPVEISSLDEYFTCFGSLAALDQVYAVLPLDEPTFDIDANTRQITVPADFKKNGLSVQGDQIAEIVYFTIDRYFDTTDLYDDDVNIIIQWETAANGKTTNKGISPAIFKDITIRKAEGKVLFGWAINSSITEFAGTIKFSVRFYRTQTVDNKKSITFSLSTLTATATINPGLNYAFIDGEPTVEVFDDFQTVFDRFKDSVTPDDITQAVEPMFLYTIPTSEDDCFNHIEEDGVKYHLVDLVAGDPDSYTFQVEATSDDGGIITYEWTRTALGSGQQNNLISNVEYLPTKDETYSADHAYYVKKNADGIDSYEIYTVSQGMVGTAISDEDKAVLLEKFSTYTATKTGDYQVTAVNRTGLSKATTSSDIVRIPGPEVLEISYPEGQENSFLTEDGEVILSATGTTAQFGDKITYQWLNGGDELQTETSEINVENTYTVPAVDEDARATFDEIYQVAIHASRNGDETEVQVENFRVTDKPHEPICARGTEGVELREGTTKVITAVIQTPDMVSDSVTYQWFQIKKADGEDEVNDPSNDLRMTEPVTIELVDNTGTVELTVSAGGSYYCVAKNNVNGASSDIVYSDTIRVAQV